jgi:hypothetical protein
MLIFPPPSIKPKVEATGVENIHDSAALVVASGQELQHSTGVGVRHFSYGEGEAMEIIPHNDEKLSRALGEAVLAIWGKLPHDVQHRVFEQAVLSQGESIRQQLAVLLHDKHPRTSDPLGKPREMMEPDSLGG